ncbi:MAG: GWxTD domain-containing protein [Gemmatimonadales bacterium]
MTRRAAAWTALILATAGVGGLAACASGARGGARGGYAGTARLFDASSVYRGMGFLVGGTGLPFVAAVRYLAGPGPDSTLALFSLSLTNHSITFQRAGSEFVAEYHVEASFRAESGSVVPVRQIGRDAEVRVRSFQETMRTDESVIFQQFVTLPPGAYRVQVAVRDRNGPAFARAERLDTVPRFATSGSTRPIAIYSGSGRDARAALPELLANPRATLSYGADSVFFYIEAYGQPPNAHLLARVVDERDRELWRDTVPLAGSPQLAAGRVAVAPATLPVGRAELETTPLAGGDTARAGFLVSFSTQWVITSYEELTSLLRYFARQEWIDSLRQAAPEARPDVWKAFWRETDPTPITPENEALDGYFRLVQQANVRFQDEGEPGWLTDRGEVFITLGEPDEEVDLSTGLNRAGFRALRWAYREYRLILIFHDQSGFGRFRLTPISRSEYLRVLARVRRSQ